ncbi:vesicle transport protein SEC22 [Fistulifera solaris]|uniref:Vesicle transport protein SEC22 n=1 Tax=Fistulifera solaris TaxID=1519565 RepID=A0A1Z5KR53_FISSO|nr:vesicle transport protein SEC22 [Fistulifera solaris]|eukprot:GAX28800.1 vesicle transport protein SEC22 [Fistulifera solaris]
MPPLLTQVARTSDSLPLVACTTATHTLPVTSKHQQDAQQLMKRMTTGSPNKMSIATGNYCFYYMSRDNLCFLTLCEESFPKRSAFLYLEEIADLILQEMIREYGNDWRNQVDQAARPFQFIHYDPIIQRKQREYREQRPQARSQLNEDLNEIHSIMRKNIDEILNRGEKLDQVSNISNDLRSKSKDFKWGTKKLTLQARLQQYGPMVVGATLFFIILYVKIFHIGF